MASLLLTLKTSTSTITSKCQNYYNIESWSEVRRGESNTNDNDNDMWVTAIVANCLFCIAFLAPSFFMDSAETAFILFRLCTIMGHLISSHVAMVRFCDARVVIWTVAFIVVNLYRLLQTAYKHGSTRYMKINSGQYRLGLSII